MVMVIGNVMVIDYVVGDGDGGWGWGMGMGMALMVAIVLVVYSTSVYVSGLPTTSLNFSSSSSLITAVGAMASLMLVPAFLFRNSDSFAAVRSPS